MKISIDDNKSIAAIQEEFNLFFPYLKLEFYMEDHDYTQPSSKKIKMVDGITIGKCRKIQWQGILIIFPEMSVADLEKVFKDSFGISVQVFRKSGNVWLETNYTDTWSLEKQNKQGELVSAHLYKQEEKRNGQ